MSSRSVSTDAPFGEGDTFLFSFEFGISNYCLRRIRLRSSLVSLPIWDFVTHTDDEKSPIPGNRASRKTIKLVDGFFFFDGLDGNKFVVKSHVGDAETGEIDLVIDRQVIGFHQRRE